MKTPLLFPLLLFLSVLLCGTCPAAQPEKNVDIVGAGATFPAPLYQHWIKMFSATSPGFTLRYDAVGSGEGVRRFLDGATQFGASDYPLSLKEQQSAGGRIIQAPGTAGMVVLAYNLPEAGAPLRLSRAVYSDIFLGVIHRWDDPRIAALNPGLRLPALDITTVVRADSSGTTWNFTSHLDAITPAWRAAGLRAAKKMHWPGNAMNVPFNEGVANRIRVARGAIGYVEYGVAKRAGLAMAELENKAGQFIAPSGNSARATLTEIAAQSGGAQAMVLTDPVSREAYPIVNYSWLFLRVSKPATPQEKQARRFIRWGLREGQQYAEEFGYIPLPESVAAAAMRVLDD